MTSDAGALEWRASAGRVAWAGWLLGAAGGSATVVAFVLAGWRQSVEAGLTSDPASVVAGLVVGIPMGGPVGGAGGIWGAAIVVALRGRRPPIGRAERIVRLAVAAVLLAVGVAVMAILDVAGGLAHMGGPASAGVVAVLGTLAIGWIVAIAARMVRVDPATAASDAADAEHADAGRAASSPTATPGRAPLVLGAALGPIAVVVVPLIAAVIEQPHASSLTSTGPGLLVLLGLGLGPLVGMALAGIATVPWSSSDDWPRPQPGRVVATLGVQIVAAAFLAFLANVLLAGGGGSGWPTAWGAVVLLATQLMLLVAAWRSHARHAADLSRSR